MSNTIDTRLMRLRLNHVGKHGVIYVVKACERQKPIKIGVTIRLMPRLYVLQNGSPLQLEIAGAIIFSELANAQRIERAALAVLDAHRLWGEWLTIDIETALRTVERLAENNNITCFRLIENFPIKSNAYGLRSDANLLV
jgi:hypothetical protein